MEQITFVGTGVVNGKDVEIRFKTTEKDIIWDDSDRCNPKITIRPILDKKKEEFMIIESE